MKLKELKQMIKEEIHILLEKHGKLDNLDEYISLTDPNAELSNSEYARIDKIEKNALAKGQLADLQRASAIKHWGRYDVAPGSDILKFRKEWIEKTKNRITKGGKLNKNNAKWLKSHILWSKPYKE